MLIWTAVIGTVAIATPTEWRGVALQARTIPSSLGFQRYHLGLSGQQQRCSDATAHPLTCWQYAAGWGLRQDLIPNDTLRTHHVHVEIQRGVLFPGDVLSVGFFAGAGTTLLLGGTTQLTVQTRPHIHGDIQLQHQTNQGDTLWISGKPILYWPTLGTQVALGWGRQW